MHLPLPKRITDHIKENAPNLSLRFYKWADVFNNNFDDIDKDDKKKGHESRKKGFFDSLIKLSEKGDYVNAFSIRKKLLEGVGVTIDLVTASRLVCGMGYEHPLENGFMFDWTSGLPVIPGSSLKGPSLNTAKVIMEHSTKEEKKMIFGFSDNDSIKANIDDIFGTKDDSGKIVFFTAYPCLEDGQQFLELDVMTPHYQPYYSDPTNPPADWYSPVPLHFLTVPEGIKFCFRLATRKNLKDTGSAALLTAQKILSYALTEFGVGAKTNVFYGFFRHE